MSSRYLCSSCLIFCVTGLSSFVTIKIIRMKPSLSYNSAEAEFCQFCSAVRLITGLLLAFLELCDFIQPRRMVHSDKFFGQPDFCYHFCQLRPSDAPAKAEDIRVVVLAGHFCTVAVAAEPVSYTHLDVDKRQVQD